MHWRRSFRRAIARAVTGAIIVVVIIIIAVAGYLVLVPPSSPTTTPSSTSQSTSSTFSASSASSSSNASLTPESWIIDFTPSGLQLPVYVGVAKGYFADQGIQMTVISNPQGSVGAVNAVAKGTATFGDADFGTFAVTIAHNNITNVKVIGGWLQNAAGSGVFYLQGKGITKPSDLNGKTIGSFTGNADEALFKLFAEKNDINISTVTINHVSVSALEPGLLNGQFSAILLYKQHVAELTPLAAKQGTQVGFFDFGQYGLSTLYGQSPITTTTMIQSNPQIVTKVLNAFYQSVQYCFQNPQAAANAMAGMVSGSNATIILEQFQSFYGYYITNSSQLASYSNPLAVGWINPDTASASLSLVAQAYGIPVPQASTIYTNQFVVAPPVVSSSS